MAFLNNAQFDAVHAIICHYRRHMDVWRGFVRHIARKQRLSFSTDRYLECATRINYIYIVCDETTGAAFNSEKVIAYMLMMTSKFPN